MCRQWQDVFLENVWLQQHFIWILLSNLPHDLILCYQELYPAHAVPVVTEQSLQVDGLDGVLMHCVIVRRCVRRPIDNHTPEDSKQAAKCWHIASCSDADAVADAEFAMGYLQPCTV